LSAIRVVECLYRLHFYLHHFAFGKRHDFLKDIVFAFFLTTNPGKFFEAAVLPLLPFYEVLSEDRVMTYPQKLPLVRLRYWRQICRFVKSLIERFKSCVALLPEGARQLVDAILKIEPAFFELRYILIVENFICRYLRTYMSTTENPILTDASKVITCLCPMQNPLRRDIQALLSPETIELDSLFEAMRPTSEPLDDLVDAFEIAGRYTLVTTRDLFLLYRGVQHFQDFVSDDKKKILQQTLVGIMEPKIISDNQFLQLRVVVSEGPANEIDIKQTQPHDDLTDLLNLLNFSNLEYETPAQLQMYIGTMCSAFISPVLQQKITPDLLTNTAQVQSNVIGNHITLKKFSERLCSALFSARNESDRLRPQLNGLFAILARNSIVPALVEQYPYDFMVRNEDLLNPKDAYARIVANVTRRISSLNLTPENEHVVRKTFFMDFVDRIDIRFDFQKMIKIDRLPQKFAQFCQANSKAMRAISSERMKVMSRTATTLQWIRTIHPISYNLWVALQALHPLSIFRAGGESAIPLAIAMSGNAEVASFVFFVMKYLRNPCITSVIMTNHEQKLINALRRAITVLMQDDVKMLSPI
jgi:hypothetical protein